jgi:hypothetical protein
MPIKVMLRCRLHRRSEKKAFNCRWSSVAFWRWSKLGRMCSLQVLLVRKYRCSASGSHFASRLVTGTGKSVLLREVIAQLRNQLSHDAVAITASTGIAGLNIGGSTVHSFAGIGLGKEPEDKLAGKILQSRRLRQRWQSLKVLLIDESPSYFIPWIGLAFEQFFYSISFNVRWGVV